MKKRNGFVSNSSTSSFIVSCKKGKTKSKVTIEIDLKDYSSSVITNVKELEEYILNEICYDNINEALQSEYWSKIYKESKTAIEKGRIILRGGFNSSNYDIESCLCGIGLKNIISKDIKIIQDDAGNY